MTILIVELTFASLSTHPPRHLQPAGRAPYRGQAAVLSMACSGRHSDFQSGRLCHVARLGSIGWRVSWIVLGKLEADIRRADMGASVMYIVVISIASFFSWYRPIYLGLSRTEGRAMAFFFCKLTHLSYLHQR